MRKIFILFLMLFMCCSCTKDNTSEVNYTYEIVSKSADMSAYDGVSSTQHMFRYITVDQLYNTIDNDSSAAFYLGRTNCECCQTCVKYLNEVATELNVTIYYIDVYNSEMPLETEEEITRLTNYLYPILEEVDGVKELQTPTVFSVVNGELKDSLICLKDWKWDNPPTESQVNRLKKKYKEILSPFVDKNQD